MDLLHRIPGRAGRGLLAAGTAGAAFALLLSGCSDSKSDSTPTPAATQATTAAASPTNTPTATATATAPATATSTPSAADNLAKTAGYFVYITRSGDTAITMANLFNGEPGSAKAGYPDQITSVNNLPGMPTAGTAVAIPILPTPKHIIPSAGLANQLANAGSGKLVLYEPGSALVTINDTVLATYGGKVALHRVELDTNLSGYRMEYWLTGAPTLDANGAFNRDTAVTQPLMVVAAGTKAAPAGSDTVQFQDGGITYSVTALSGATDTPAALKAGLVVVQAP